jgi:hypothetical protein
VLGLFGVLHLSGCGTTLKTSSNLREVEKNHVNDSLWVRPVLQRTKTGIKLKSLILAQIERWRHALHMQVERTMGLAPWLVANG